jgi:eukaryotic-like serine/threonine-protein kinase
MPDDAPAIPATGLDTRPPGIRVGSYRILQALGSGGMSSVFKAEHIETGVVVAVKVLPRNLARNKTLLQRFVREAKSAEALEHPNVVAIYDHGTDDGRYYLVLEYVEGGDLHDWVRAHGPMRTPEAVGAIRAVAEGLKFAADLGLIHRDIKPANILRAIDGRIKIADLGLALQADDEDERVTREGTTVGTVDYMAPEQARDSRATSVRSDIYSLGCTFFFLLTGQPPYPGGDVTEKLTRHVTAPVPELTGFRPEAPPALSRLIQRMLAKKPENRFADYSELIAALDVISSVPGAPVRSDQAGADVPLLALLDDDSDEIAQIGYTGFQPLTLPGPIRADEAQLPPPVLSMADLIELEDSDAFAKPPRREEPSVRKQEAQVVDSAALVASSIDEDDSVLDDAIPAAIKVATERRMSDAERSWIVACVAIGLSLILFVIGSDLLIHSTSNVTEAPPIPILPPPPSADDPPEAPSPHPKAVAIATKPIPPPRIQSTQPANAVVALPVEPTEPLPERVAEPAYPQAVEARFRPDWALRGAVARLPGKFLTVRRLPDPRDGDSRATLEAALEVVGGGTIEVADNGPFFEDDLRVIGDARALRARPGFRPIISLEASRNLTAASPTAVLDLGGRELTLDGLDLVVDVKLLAAGQTALFLCRGGTLTLRNCTVTVLNRVNRPFSLVQTAPSERPSRVRLERTFVRGAIDTVVALAGGAGDVFLDRSVVLNGLGTLVRVSGTEPAERRVFSLRSVVATKGPTIESALSPASRPRPLLLKALGSTFAHLGNSSTPFISAHASASATELVSWDGISNEFEGWSTWLSAGFPASVRVQHLAAARTIWVNGDTESRETGTEWTLPAPIESVSADKLRRSAPGHSDVLVGVAVPSPFLLEKTVDSFPSPADPGSIAPTRRLPSLGPNLSGPARLVTVDPNFPSAATQSTVPVTPALTRGVRDVTFSTVAPEWGGDLGRFLATTIKPGDHLIRVRIVGAGAFNCTPIRLPEGVSLDLEAHPEPNGQFVSWTAPRGASAEALIDARGGGIRLVGIELVADAGSKIKSLVRVERGHLAIHRCRLRSIGPVEAGGGGLIHFEAPGSQPLPAPAWSDPSGAWPFERPTDKPTCRVSESVLNSAHDAVTAVAGRGLLWFQQCVVIAGGAAFQLTPGRLARHRFEADLTLDYCTLAAETSCVGLGAWAGAEPGPDRPWLVSTHRCAFFGTYSRGTGASILLRVDTEGFARGALFWQAAGDAFEMPVFTATADSSAPDSRRPDVIRQWIELWGANHIRSVTGPRSPHFTITARPIVQRLRPGHVEAEDLFLDPTFPPDSPPPRDLGVDLRALGLTPPARHR